MCINTENIRSFGIIIFRRYFWKIERGCQFINKVSGQHKRWSSEGKKFLKNLKGLIYHVHPYTSRYQLYILYLQLSKFLFCFQRFLIIGSVRSALQRCIHFPAVFILWHLIPHPIPLRRQIKWVTCSGNTLKYVGILFSLLYIIFCSACLFKLLFWFIWMYIALQSRHPNCTPPGLPIHRRLSNSHHNFAVLCSTISQRGVSCWICPGEI